MTQSALKKTGEGTKTLPAQSLLVWVGLVSLTTIVMVPLATAQFGTFSDLKGDYCRGRRPTSCCDGRYDDCSMPIRGTLCYCDQFCNRTYNPDCCPDYWEICLGFSPPAEIVGCYKAGLYIPSGHSYKFNCNECHATNEELQCSNEFCRMDTSLRNSSINHPQQFGSRPPKYSKFWGRKGPERSVLRMGHHPEGLSMRMHPIHLRPDVSHIPRYFDARNKREWQGRVSGVSDQGWCGASWAFSTLGVTQDRLSIESLGNESVRLAPQHLISCDRRGQSGCQGGHVDRAWQYLRRIGVVNEECYAYESGRTGQVPVCRIPHNANLFSLRCAAEEVVYQRNDLYKTEPAYRISGKEIDIQWEILTNGPVQAMMTVHSDLFIYESGVYSFTGLAGQETAMHSVRIIGWGEDNSLGSVPVKYWLVANSWGSDWGERGFFRIRRGTNESDIESFIIAVRARLGAYATSSERNASRRPGSRSYRSRNRVQEYHDKNY
nr:uncharacterized peptidase C1-like protein F26E4.3 [Cherax quadricarinatus]